MTTHQAGRIEEAFPFFAVFLYFLCCREATQQPIAGWILSPAVWPSDGGLSCSCGGWSCEPMNSSLQGLLGCFIVCQDLFLSVSNLSLCSASFMLCVCLCTQIPISLFIFCLPASGSLNAHRVPIICPNNKSSILFGFSKTTKRKKKRGKKMLCRCPNANAC